MTNDYVQSYRDYLKKAVEVGEKIGGLEESLVKIKYVLGKTNGEEIFSDTKGFIYDNVFSSMNNFEKTSNPKRGIIQKLTRTKPKPNTKKLRANLAKTEYFCALMFETITCEKLNDKKKSGKYGFQIGEIAFLNEYPRMREKLLEIAQKMEIIDRFGISELYTEQAKKFMHDYYEQVAKA